MEELWHKMCNHFAVPEDVAKSWYTRIYQRLNESHSKRYYHNWNEMMQHKREHLQHCKPALVLAAFFQYYSYDGTQPCAKENCAAFEEFCSDAAVDDQESKNLILKLLGDKSAENELENTFEDDANLLQDLDLAILAASSEDYKRYCQLLRMEYEHMSDEDYKIMRLKVLQTLLSIPNIFSTADFQTRYEASARANMKAEISTLKV
uniref:Maltose/maltodextrin import ATP-binding protein MalK n=1 Tax=Zeugodacus cucurbitae TaxID=28588 RepID=A0A0A1XIH2_ZEUCU